MNGFKYLALVAVAGICFTVTAPKIEAQVSVGISVGAAPDCPYGYYDYAPYSCSPYGYYGPEWFTGGAFTGAGPWFHGADNFQGHVNSRFDAQRGYRGRTLAIKLSRQSVSIRFRISREMKCAMGAVT